MSDAPRARESLVPEVAVVAMSAAVLALYFALKAPLESAPDIVLFLGRFHPLAVHLPIGILLFVAFAEALTLSAALRKRIDPTTPFALGALVVSGFGSFALGQLLASGGGFAAKLAATHRTLTLFAVLAMGGCFVVYRASARAERAGAAWGLRLAYRGVLGLTVGLLSLGAHYGGSITRGEAYLTKYAPGPIKRLLGPDPQEPETSSPEQASADPLFFEAVVMPVLKQRCVECHGPETTKGGLRVDTMAAMLKGGDSGPAIVAGQGAKSPLVARMLLPVSDEDRMPPEGKPGPEQAEIALVSWWIDRGASAEMRVRDALPPEASRALLEKLAGGEAASSAPSTSTSATTKPNGGPPPTRETSEPETSASPHSNEGPVSETASVWSTRVAPVLTSKCGSCHGPAKAKGRLRVDSIESLTSGGKGGPAIVAGASTKGTLLARVHLPSSDGRHMPPPERPQMTEPEIQLVAWWIDQGASADTKIAALPDPLKKAFASAPAPAPAPAPGPFPVDPLPPPATAEPEPALPAEILAKLPEEVPIYERLVAPILHDRCATCHDAAGRMGGLDVGTVEAMKKGGDSGPSIVAGKPNRSSLFVRMKLPLRHGDHMPPKAMAQPERGELAAVELWIREGARKDTAVKVAAMPASAQSTLARVLGVSTEVGPGPAPSASASAPPATSGSAAPGPITPSPSASVVHTASLPTASASASTPSAPPHSPPTTGCASCTVAEEIDGPRWGSRLWMLGLAALIARRGPRRGRD